MKKIQSKNTSQPCSHETRPQVCNSPLIMAVFERIAQERVRQNELFVEGKFSCNCSSIVADDNRKLRVLTEEVGEVAQAIDRLESGDCWLTRQHLQEELVQVAAVAVAWLEAMEARCLKPQCGARARKLPPVTQEEIDTILHGRSL